MDRQLSHLITGAELAIKNWPTIDTSNPNKYHKLFADDFTARMEEVLLHYQRGWTIFNRPVWPI